jgi:hypothetical protein
VYTIDDGGGGNNASATVTLIITPPSPLAPVNYTWTMPPSGTTYSPPYSLLNNVTQPNPSGNLTVTGVTVPPSVGNLTTGPNPDGTYVFTPPPGWTGTVTFCVNVTDGVAPAPVEVCTSITRLPPPPVAVDDVYYGLYNTPRPVNATESILLNDAPSTAGATMTFRNVTRALSPAGAGALTTPVASDGTFVFTPAASFWGNATFEYEMGDSVSQQTARATVTIIIPAPLPPVALNNTYAGTFGFPYSPSSGSLLVDNDASPYNAQLDVTSVGTPSVGTVTVQPNGTFVFTPPTLSWFGTAVFPYTITDRSTGLNATAYASITVAPSGPVAVDDAYTCYYNAPCSPPGGAPGILANDTSPSGGTLTVTGVVTPPSFGTVTVDANGTFVYTPQL